MAELVALWTTQAPGEKQQKKKEDVVLHVAIAKALVLVKALKRRGESKYAEAALSGVFCRYASLLANS